MVSTFSSEVINLIVVYHTIMLNHLGAPDMWEYIFFGCIIQLNMMVIDPYGSKHH